MTRENIESYVSSLTPIKNLLKMGTISISEFIIAEDHLAKKYCIKKGSLFRPNDLINSSKRVIYSTAKKEVENDAKEDIENRSITAIKKET